MGNFLGNLFVYSEISLYIKKCKIKINKFMRNTQSRSQRKTGVES